MSEEIKKDVPVVNNDKIEETPKATGPKMREIIILTDGNNIELKKADVSGKIELVAILQNLIGYLSQPENK